MAAITPISDKSHRSFIVRFSGLRIHTTVARCPSAVRTWISLTRHLHRRSYNRLIVGLGAQWPPKLNRSDHEPFHATIQLCVGRRCLIIQLTRSASIPRILKQFLEDHPVIFTGVNIQYDCRLLSLWWGLRVERAVELRRLAATVMGRGNASMAAMADVILGIDRVVVEMAKPEEVGMSKWDVRELSHRQVVYAAVDAYVSFRLGLKLIWGN